MYMCIYTYIYIYIHNVYVCIYIYIYVMYYNVYYNAHVSKTNRRAATRPTSVTSFQTGSGQTGLL